MFNVMDKDQNGLGVFHDPTIALTAKFLGFEDARSLSDMESITFTMDDDGNIDVVGINPAGTATSFMISASTDSVVTRLRRLSGFRIKRCCNTGVTNDLISSGIT